MISTKSFVVTGVLALMCATENVIEAAPRDGGRGGRYSSGWSGGRGYGSRGGAYSRGYYGRDYYRGPSRDYGGYYARPDGYRSYAPYSYGYRTYGPGYYRDGYATAIAPQGRRAFVTVQAPAEAEVWFAGVKAIRNGSEHRFRTRHLAPGRSYNYTVRARWTTDDGKEVVKAKTVRLRAGKRMVVNFG